MSRLSKGTEMKMEVCCGILHRREWTVEWRGGGLGEDGLEKKK